jgi:heat shock protein HslJ
MKTFIAIVVSIAVVVGAFFAFNSYIYNEKQGDTTTLPETIENTDTAENIPPGVQGEMGENPEGEADPNRMTLGMTKWNWISTTVGTVKTTPKKAGAFTLTFKTDGTFSATTDCNGLFGSYKATGKYIVFSNIASTKMFCEGSQEGEYGTIFGNATGFVFTSRGELIFTLKNGGSAVFR